MPETAIIIEIGLVVTCDAHRRTGPMALLVRNGRIAEIVSRSETLRARYPAAEIIDASSRVVVPGFVDAHYHGESFVLRHWTTTVPYGDWPRHPKTKKILSHVHREISSERLGIFYRLAYFAALRAGITFINEYGINNLDLPFLAALEGFRRTDLQGM
ncbi:MAG: amidohydrolase family protein, partial [Proteobacteria bacterium]|nr:amidohydrolase family protein [Pseudomonadota bacterium]